MEYKRLISVTIFRRLTVVPKRGVIRFDRKKVRGPDIFSHRSPTRFGPVSPTRPLTRSENKFKPQMTDLINQHLAGSATLAPPPPNGMKYYLGCVIVMCCEITLFISFTITHK